MEEKTPIQLYRREYFERNRVEYFNVPHNCEICGGRYTFINKSHHNKSKKHQLALQNEKLKVENDLLKQLIVDSSMGDKINPTVQAINKIGARKTRTPRKKTVNTTSESSN